MDTAPRSAFPLPSDIGPVPGAENAKSMYPYYVQVGPEDDGRYWFYNAMHFPEPMPAFDTITAEAPYCALGAFNTRVHVLPTVLGIDHRIINGRVYITGNAVTDPAVIGERLQLFQERAFYYYGNWDRLYAQWKEKMMALINDASDIHIPDLPKYDDEESQKAGRGIAQNHFVLDSYQRCIEGYFRMWQHHFEFLLLGYGAYMTFFLFCKKAFPEITDQTVARMVAGIDALMFRPDEELKKLARLSVELGIDGAFAEGRSAHDILADVNSRGEAGRRWLAAYDKARDPWFNMSTGDGFYHHHRAWKDDLAVPFSALTAYVKRVKAGETLERPYERLRAERARIIAEYRALMSNDEERGAFDQMLALSHLVFPYVEDHKFYCEHWYTTLFFNKIREFGALLAREGVFADAEDIFHLHHTEVQQALSDLMLAWSTGSAPRGCTYWPPIVAERKAMLKVLEDWKAPPALGPVPEVIEDPALIMLWGITADTLKSWHAQAAGGSSRELRGFAASPGLVEGRACVVKSVAEIGRLREGDILVCPVTNPSWAPIFGKIKAAVSDIGGSMSHAAIVAREYGLPAVVGTGTATKTIRDGARIRVDGTTGIVTLLD